MLLKLMQTLVDKSHWRALWTRAWTASAHQIGTRAERDALWRFVNENTAVGK
jgi:hypothetical protein